MTKNNYAEFYLRIRELGLEKEAVVSDFTDGRTESLRELSQKELTALCASLRKTAQGTNVYVPKDNPKGDRLRKAIISIFHQMRYDEPAVAAKAWAEKMGAYGGEKNVKKPFNHYSNQELMNLLMKAENALADFRSSVRKNFENA